MQEIQKTQAQTAINWLISKPNVITIPKSIDVAHIKENLGALGWKLNEEDSGMLERYFSRRAFFSNLFSTPIRIIKNFVMNNLSEQQLKKLMLLYQKIRKKFP